MSSFYSAFVNTLLFFAPRSNSVQSNTHHAPFCIFPANLISLPSYDIEQCSPGAHPPGVQCWSPGHNTTAGLGSLLLLYSTSHSGQGIFSKKYTFSSWRDQPTRQRHFLEFCPIIAFSRLLRTPLDINKHALEEFLPGCENVGVHKSWVNSGLTPASPAGGAVMDLVAVLLLYFSILHQL